MATSKSAWLPASSVQSSGAIKGEPRPILAICGDPHNLGDLALLLQNIDEARRQRRRIFVRRWHPLPPAIEHQIARAGGQLVDGRRHISRLREATGCDMVIGGGQIVRQNISLAALMSLAALSLAVRAGGGRIETRGLGIGKTRGLRRRLWRSILRRASTIKVRDAASLEQARRLCPDVQACLTADMAFLGDLAAWAAAGEQPSSILVALCEDASEGRSVADRLVCDLVQRARARWSEAPVVGVVHDLRESGDRARLRALRDVCGELAIVDAEGDLSRLLALYRDAVLVLTNRLHSGIFATLFGRPLVVLDDGNPKLALLYEKLAGERIQASDDASGRIPSGLLDRAVERSIDGVHGPSAKMRLRAEGNVTDVTRTAIFNVKFSPNLGDGIIAECLETALRGVRPDLDLVSIDLAGRTVFGRGTGLRRGLLLRVLEAMPGSLRAVVVPAILSSIVRYRLRPAWRRALRNCDSAIVGGGALLADTDQNFPIKISNVLKICADRGLPVAISHVGVTRGWSASGRARMLAALSRSAIIGITVRDAESVANFEGEFGDDLPKPRLALDPGLLCCEVYESARPDDGWSRKRIGLCLTDPLVLRLHGRLPVARGTLKQWWCEVLEQMGGSDRDVLLFTNGSPEDEHFAEELLSEIAGKWAVSRMPRFVTPGDLTRFISTLDCIVAHRLHACIAAYSYRISAIGIAWDKKLESFFELVGRQGYVIDSQSHAPEEVAALIDKALADPPGIAEHARILDQCRKGVAELAESIVAARRVP